MSIASVLVCLDCRTVAPPIGDYGFIGWPSMDEQPTAPSGEAREWAEFLPFGCIRKTFADVGISTDELEQFAEFMRHHEGHRFGIAADGELQDPVEGGQAIVDEIEEARAIPTPLAYSPQAERARGGFVIGRYSLTCECGARYATPNPAVLRPLADVRWTPELLHRFRSRILEIDPCNFWRVSELLDPGTPGASPAPVLREIEAFLVGHLDHGVTARIRQDG